MKYRSLYRLLLGAFLILSLAAPTFADSTPDAQKWLEKLITIYDRGPFSVDYEARLDLASLGQPMSGMMVGKLTQADRTHSRIEVKLDLTGAPGMPGGMSMSILTVTDGTTVWSEMGNPALGGAQITKVSLADLAEVGESVGGGFGGSPKSMDPVVQLEMLTQTMDFEVLERAGGAVTLRGTVTDETRAKMPMLAPPGVDAFVIVLDEKTGFPTQFRADGENPFAVINFRNLEFVDAASLPAGLFEYSPPEGVPVKDLGAMLKSHAK